MKYLKSGLTILLGAFMVFMGTQKFGAHNPVFSYLEWQSGIGLFEPGIRIFTGILELVAAGLLFASFFLPRLKGLGALLSVGVIGGAIVFHLSPWLGIHAPVAFADGATPPFSEPGDYVKEPFLFVMALVFLAISLTLTYLDRDGLKSFLVVKPEA